jgi:cytidine deaminase
MKNLDLHIRYTVFDQIQDLPASDNQLLLAAINATALAYAPYSGFHVGSVALLKGGILVPGANQENASFPAGICAERVLLSAIASQYPGATVEAMAISYRYNGKEGDHPVAPCGICRQSLVEFEERNKQPIRLILGSEKGEVWVFESCASILPFYFSKGELNQ